MNQTYKLSTIKTYVIIYKLKLCFIKHLRTCNVYIIKVVLYLACSLSVITKLYKVSPNDCLSINVSLENIKMQICG